jgi:uncharacterized protein
MHKKKRIIMNPYIPSAFHLMAKPTGSRCNLACRYCFYLSKRSLYPESRFRMSDEVQESYIRQLFKTHQAPEVTVAWQGGEPTLMGLEFFRRSIELQQGYLRPGTTIQNTIQTNGTLLDDEWCRFFKQHNFLVGISIDGPRKLHDAYRVDRHGRGTFDRVMQGLSLLKNHGVDFNILAAVHAANGEYPLEVYRFFRDEAEARFIQFIPVVEQNDGTGVATEWSVKSRQYGKFLTGIFDEWVRHDVGSVFVQHFDAALASWLGVPPSLCIFAPACGTAMVLEHNGDVYSCDHFVEAEHRLGNIMESPLRHIIARKKRFRFASRKSADLPAYCKQCRVLFACNGGCPKNRFIKTPDGEAGLNYLCRGYRLFFTHIDEAMRFMADELSHGGAPARVMNEMRRKMDRNTEG